MQRRQNTRLNSSVEYDYFTGFKLNYILSSVALDTWLANCFYNTQCLVTLLRESGAFHALVFLFN